MAAIAWSEGSKVFFERDGGRPVTRSSYDELAESWVPELRVGLGGQAQR